MFLDYIFVAAQLILGSTGATISIRNVVASTQKASVFYSVVWIALTLSFFTWIVCLILGQPIPETSYLIIIAGLAIVSFGKFGLHPGYIPKPHQRVWKDNEYSRIGALLLVAVPTLILGYDRWFVSSEIPIVYKSFRLLTPSVPQGEAALLEVTGIKNRDDCGTEVRNMWFDKKTSYLIAETKYPTGYLPPGPFQTVLPRPTQGVDSRNVPFKLQPGEIYMRTKVEFNCDNNKYSYWSPLLKLDVLPNTAVTQ
jgi:hypothetical protein